MGVMPRQRRFTVVGTVPDGPLRCRLADRLVDLEPGMLLAGTDRVDHIEVKVANVYDAPRIADRDRRASSGRTTSRRTGPTSTSSCTRR